MKEILYKIAAIPALALIGGVGILAWRIGATWTSATTQSLVTALTVICGGGALLFAILLALIVGIPLAIRAYGEGGASRRQWGELAPSRRRLRSAPRWQDAREEAWEEEWAIRPTKRQPQLIEGQWSRPPAPSATPPSPSWSAPSGQTQLLPPAEQDTRFGLEQ